MERRTRTVNEQDAQAHAFAELVRQTSARIAGLSGAGQNVQAAELAISLSDQAADRKREIEDRQSDAKKDL